MARLAPPIVEGTIPAFYMDGEDALIQVPFGINRGVSPASIKNFKLKIKTIVNSTYLTTCDSTILDEVSLQEALKNGIVSFNLKGLSLNEGQFYKVQMAYVDINNEIGYYSAVSTVKFTTKPVLKIIDLDTISINNFNKKYIGVYSQDITKDATEKVYKYIFTILDSNGDVFYSTGYQIHNSENDVQFNESQDEFYCPYEIDDQIYTIKYSVITINNLKAESPSYQIQAQPYSELIDLPIIQRILNYDNGYVSFCIKNNTNSNLDIQTDINKKYVILRACQNTNYFQWDILYTFVMPEASLEPYSSYEIFRDYTFEHGKFYKYAIADFNDLNKRFIFDELYCDFEASFLFDGEKQLKITFNPQISSFKTDILEQKIDTIGSKYPFFIRNGNVCYKEFPISGLISYFMDEEQIFMTNEELGLEEDINEVRTQNPSKELSFSKGRTNELVSYNFNAERIFKLKVMEWLNNNNVKLFRSPSEGNYLVHIMNVSLSPNQQLGRLIHTFNCQAYEFADCDNKNMIYYNILPNAN